MSEPNEVVLHHDEANQLFDVGIRLDPTMDEAIMDALDTGELLVEPMDDV